MRHPTYGIAHISAFVTLVLAGTRNSSMAPPCGIDPKTHRTMSRRSYHGATSRSWEHNEVFVIVLSIKSFFLFFYSALKPTSSWESSPKVAGLETYALSTAPLTVSVFTYMTSLTKPVCSVTSLTNKSYSVTSGSGMNIVSCLESGCSKNTPSVVERASSNFAPFTTVRGVTSLPNILLDSSLPSSNFQQVNMTSSVPTFVRPQTTLFGNAVRGEHCSKWPDASDVTTVMSRQTPKSTSSIKLSPCSSILNAMTSLR